MEDLFLCLFVHLDHLHNIYINVTECKIFNMCFKNSRYGYFYGSICLRNIAEDSYLFRNISKTSYQSTNSTSVLILNFKNLF